MKKLIVTLSLMIASSSAMAMNQQFVNNTKEGVKNICINLINEEGPVKDQKKMKAYCGRVANCVVAGAPNEFYLQDKTYMQNAFMLCIAKEAEKEAAM